MRPRSLRALRPEPLFYKCWCATVCILLAAGACAYECKDASVQPTAEGAVVVSAVAWGGASDALLALAVGALRARGVPAAPAPAPAECGADAAARACQEALLRALACGDVHAALLPVAAARPPDAVRMRDHFLEEFGDAAPPARLACWALGGARAARSLLDLADEDTAALYDVTLESLLPNCTDTRQRPNNDHDSKLCSESNTTSYEYNSELCVVGASCGTLLTRTVGEARTLSAVAREWRLRVRVRVAASGALSSVAALLCSRTPPDAPERYLPLGPPPCATGRDCAFDSYRLVKIGNALKLAYSPSAISVLSRLSLQEEELRELERNATLSGAEAAAAETLARHPSWAGPGREVRVAVMVPATTPREAYDARALHAAAALAETASPRGSLRYKVEMLDDRCSATQAFKYLTDARGSEWGALAGVAGPACGAPFADVARQGAALALPLLAYTAQAPPPGEARALALLAAGDARLQARAWAAWLAQSGWRRAAVLSELATRAALDVADLGVDVLVHVELPADQDDAHLIFEQVSKWVSRVVAVNGRVLYVAAEDARVVRAALCAGGAAGLSPGAGAVWLLPALAPAALRPAPSDAHNCTHERLLELADGHFSLAPAWLADWNATAPERRDWADMWREACRRLRDAPDCDAPSPHAALLYDVLRLWDATVRRLLAVRPAALDDFHHVDIVRSLLEDATAAPYEGVTGTFAWTSIGGVHARSSPLVLSQWQGGVARRVATWAGALAPGPAALRWLTADGAVPDDGGERCGLQALADALGADCRTAFVALGASLLAVLVAALAAAAWQCKRRAERKYRRRLAALGLTRLGPKPGGLDRWEIPRTRVVINRKLGTGAFGTVYGGHALLGEDRGWTAVAVKTLKPGASTEEKLDFLSEAEAMKRFDHKNVVRLLAVVTKTEPVCTVMEFMLYGDLKNYLLARRHLSDGEEVSALRLTGMALDAARALSYLAQLRYVHRDVAARNCLVSAHRVVKLADFGMTRLVFENDYYRFSRKGMLPVRWMAPESLGLGVFSPASDVWSFGVLLYEIVTFGSLPFQGLSNAEVLARVKAGHTLELPAGLKPQLEGLIKSCWQQEYKARPCAAEIAAFLADSPRLLTPCLDVPLDALPLDDSDAPWRLATDRAEARWVSWGAPASAATDTTYLSTDAPPQDTDAFLP